MIQQRSVPFARILIVLSAVLAFAAPVSAGGVRLEGTAWAEVPVDRLTVRAWPLGRSGSWPAMETAPLAETVIAPGRPFVLDLPRDALPVRVEIDGKGLVAVARTVVLEEDASLPPAWLRRGHRVEAVVRRNGKPAAGAVVRGTVRTGSWSVRPERWSPSVPVAVCPKNGRVAFEIPPNGPAVTLSVTDPADGGWASLSRTNVSPGAALTVSIGSRPLKVLVRDRRGRPLAGAVVAPAGAPRGTAVRTDGKGRAAVQVGDGEWRLVALAADAAGTLSGREIPENGAVVDTEPLEKLTVRWESGLGPLALSGPWLSGALGLGPLPARGGSVRLPFLSRGRITWHGPGVAPGSMSVSGARAPVTLHPAPAVRFAGRAVTAGGDPAPAGLPVWVSLPAEYAAVRGEIRGSASWIPSVRPWLPWGVTGADGTFTIDGLPAGPLSLELRKTGLPPARTPRTDTKPGQTVEATLVLRPGTTLTARVVDPDGAPIPGVTVDVFQSRDSGPRNAVVISFGGQPRRGDPDATGVTDGEGAVTVRQVPRGKAVAAFFAGGYVPRRLPDVEVPPEGADLGEVELTPGVTIRGTTTDPEGRPVAGAEVALLESPQMPFFNPVTRSDADGRFEIPDVDPHGERYLQARAEGYVPRAPLKVTLPPEGDVELRMDVERKLTGLVVSAEDHQPIRDARIELMQRNTMSMGGVQVAGMIAAGSATTLPDGTFEIGGLSEGGYSAEISARGFQRTSRSVAVPAEGNPPPLTVELRKGFEIHGTVVDENGTPVDGVRVMAGAGETWSHATSGPGGAFTVEGLPRGTVEVRAVAQDGRKGKTTAEAGSAEPVTVTLSPGVAIRGTVTTTGGEPVPGASVLAFSPQDGSQTIEATSDAAGSFALEGAQPGSWLVRASADGFASARKTVTVPDRGEPEPVRLELAPGHTLHGTVRGLSGAELEGCGIWSPSGATAKPDADGRFTLEGLPAGTVEITAMVMPGNRSRTVTAEIPEDADPPEVEIDFGGGATLSGTVTRGGAPVPGLTVTAGNVTTGSSNATVTGEAGGYTFESLDAGEYQVAVRGPSGEVLAGDHVILDGDGVLDFELPTAALSGFVLEEGTRRPLGGATVTVSGSGLPHVERTVSCREDGSFAVEELPPGAYTVRATAQGHTPAQHAVTVEEGVPATVTLTLADESALRLRLSGAAPARVSVIPLAQGQVGPAVDGLCDRSGLCTVRGIPAGTPTLLVRTTGAAGLVRATLPSSDPVPVVLRPTGQLRISAPPGEGGAVWNVRLRDGATGLVVPLSGWRNPARGEWAPVPASGLQADLPAGSCTIEAISPTGATGTRTVEVPAGGTARVAFGAGEEN